MFALTYFRYLFIRSANSMSFLNYVICISILSFTWHLKTIHSGIWRILNSTIIKKKDVPISIFSSAYIIRTHTESNRYVGFLFYNLIAYLDEYKVCLIKKKKFRWIKILMRRNLDDFFKYKCSLSHNI